MRLHIRRSNNEITYFVGSNQTEKLFVDQHYGELIIEAFSQAQNFLKVIRRLVNNQITCTNLLLNENDFSGNVNCDALIMFICYAKNPIQPEHRALKNIHIQENEESSVLMSNSDLARLSQYSPSVNIILPDRSLLVRDSLNAAAPAEKIQQLFKNIGTKITSVGPCSYLYKGAKNPPFSSARDLLRDTFSVYDQQRTRFTCGAACVIMVMRLYYNLYHEMRQATEPLITFSKHFSKMPTEELLAKYFKTTSIGTDVTTMAKGLDVYAKKQGLPAYATSYSLGLEISDDKQTRKALVELLQRFEGLLDAGVPIIVNHLRKFGTEAEEGHFSVITAIDFKENTVILADPAARFDGKVEHQEMSIGELIQCWRSESGNRPGKYFVLFPNETIKRQLLPVLQPAAEVV
jgi:predicted double-glycine peptidase